MIDLLKESIWKQFEASIDMLEGVIVLCPKKTLSNNKRFFYTVYHTLIFLDYYLTIPPKSFHSRLPFTIKDDIPEEALDDIVPDRFYGKQELLDYLKAIRKKCNSRILSLDVNSIKERWIEDPRHGKMDFPILEILLYNMRHVQHHTAQLNMILREEIGSSANWVNRTKN